MRIVKIKRVGQSVRILPKHVKEGVKPGKSMSFFQFQFKCFQAEYLPAHSQINHFQNGRQEVIVTKYNLNKRPNIPFKPSNITNLRMHKSLLALLLLYRSCKLSTFKMADKMAAKWSFYHNLCISSADLINILGESLQNWTRVTILIHIGKGTTL